MSVAVECCASARPCGGALACCGALSGVLLPSAAARRAAAASLDPVAAPSPPVVVKVAVLVPLSSQGQPGVIAASLKQAAELALFERDNHNLRADRQGRQGHAGRSQGRRRGRAQERRHADPGAALCQVGGSRGAGGAQGRRAGGRLLQRPAGGRQRRLSPELPAGTGGRAGGRLSPPSAASSATRP